MRFTVIVFLLIIAAVFATSAQQLKYTAFTVADGLPSNNVYRAIEDNSGFLWVTTDGGIARFDGKHFQLFTTKQGLPDNAVLEVVKENNGRLWVNCFKQKPAYFDEKKNRFINATEDTCLAKVPEGTGIITSFPLKDGGVLYVNEKGSFVFKNKKLIVYPPLKGSDLFVKENKDGSYIGYGGVYFPGRSTSESTLYQIKNNKIIDSFLVRTIKFETSALSSKSIVDDSKVYTFSPLQNHCFIYGDITTHPLRCKKDSISLPEHFAISGVNDHYVFMLGYSGKMYVFDKKTLKQVTVIDDSYLPNAVYNAVYQDGKGNLWLSTFDKGLLLYKKTAIAAVTMPTDFKNTTFLSIVRKPDGTLLAGNSYGEALEIKGKTNKLNVLPKQSKELRVRKILLYKNKVFIFSERGVIVDYKRVIMNQLNKMPFAAKTAIKYDDSTAIFGLLSGLVSVNMRTEKAIQLNSAHKRITAINKSADGFIYFGSTDGLYKHDYFNNRTIALNQNSPLLSKRVTALCTTADSLIWVATASDGVIALKHDRMVGHFTENNGIINNAILSISAAIPGQVWLGTESGISIVKYWFKGGVMRYSVQNLSVNDGLTNNTVNEMICHNDTVFAATGNGISVIPANITIPPFNIPTQMIGISVNQRDTILSSSYQLRYDQQNIQMKFAGIELGGHFKNLQYTIDKNRNWITLDENTLTVQLTNGLHVIQVRAVDVNGNVSNKMLTVKFDIATPFWKSVWFWVTLALLMQVVIIYLINHRQKKRKENRLAKEILSVQTASLEQQAFTSLMNPHFMFNALNSIQHYINLQDRQNANRYLSDFASLIRKNFEAAQLSFIPLEQEIENIKIYLRLEQMRFSERFIYDITIEETLDVEEWMIPTMILQPLLENALLHGIIPSAIDGKITLDFKEQEHDLLVTIADNGIGLANSAAMKINADHKSRGMELIKKRISALGRFGTHQITISMQPAFTDEKNPGNKIVLFIPQELYQAWQQAQKK
ncbi:MAG: two-component regulator propeller domain-containing protein [Mucilaginibacter sp.]